MNHIPTLQDIEETARRIRPYIHRTPVMTSQSLNKLVKAELFFKCENFQKTGSFKIRGASSAVFSLSDEEAANGVATHSSGNHGQALAYAAMLRNIAAYIVMPENSPQVKKAGVEAYQAEAIFCKPTLKAREEKLSEVVADTGAHFVHPYNDYRVIRGQATAALELFEAVEFLDIIMAPVGGGGLISGTALTTHYLSPSTRVIGAEPAAADDAFRSYYSGKLQPSVNPATIADGLRGALGEKTFEIIQKHVHQIVTVEEESIVKAMKYIWERMKIIIEPSCAVPFAALLSGKPDAFKGKRIGIILSGGNVDLEALPFSSYV